MALGMVHSRSYRTWEGGNAEEEGRCQAAHHTNGREKVEGNSSSWGKGNTQSGIESHWVEGHRSSNNNTGGRGSNREGGWGPSNVLVGVGGRGGRNSRRERIPNDNVHTVKAPTRDRKNRTEEEGQGLEVGHWPNHPNRGGSPWHWWYSARCHRWGSLGFYAGALDYVGGPQGIAIGVTGATPLGGYPFDPPRSRILGNRAEAARTDGKHNSVVRRGPSSSERDR